MRGSALTPKELVKEVAAVMKVHPDVADHQMFAACCKEGFDIKIPLNYVKIDKRRNQIILEY